VVRALSPPTKKFYTLTIITMTKTHNFSWEKSQTKEQKRFYTTYINIKSRCYYKNNKSYKDYGFRWIRCLRNNFEEFKNDMWDSFLQHITEFWYNNTSIDRIDNNGDYCKGNCKRATREEQGNNKRNNKRMIIDGKEYSAKDLMEILWIWEWAAQNRITQYLNWKMTKERVFNKNKLFQPRKKYNIDGDLYDVHRLMNECGVTLSAAESRLRNYVKGRIWKDILFHKWNIKNKK